MNNSFISSSLASALTLTSVLVTPPAFGQQWGLLQPDGSIRQRGLILDGPNPGRILEQRLVLPLDRRSIDLHTGTIRRGGLIESGPDPSIRLQLCLQLGLC